MIKTLCHIALLLFSGLLHAQWVAQPSGTNANIFSGSFPSVDTAFVVGYSGLILRTTNGGAVWTNKSLQSFENLNAVHFINASSGWLLTSGTEIYHTTNAGESWQLQTATAHATKHIFFVNTELGYAVGGAEQITKTTDGGQSWTQQPTGISGSTFAQVYFISPLNGWAAGSVGNQGALFKTTDGGSSWTLQNLQPFPVYLYAVSFVDDSVGYASGYREIILKTTDAGTIWSVQHQTGGQGLYSLSFVSRDTGYAVGDSKILYTTNGGALWVEHQHAFSGRLQTVQFVSRNAGWIAGAFGTILKTTNTGGLTSVNRRGGEMPGGFALHQNYPNPFNPTTRIRFRVADYAFVSLKVFDVLGREVITLVNEDMSPGNYERVLSTAVVGNEFASGVYFYRLSAGSYLETRRMVLMK